MLTRWDYETIKKYQHPYIKLKVDDTEITGDDILAGSVSYKGGASSGGSLEPGGCIIGSLSFALYNYDGKYTSLIADGARVILYIGYGASSTLATYKSAAVLYISEWTIKRGSITVTAYDALRKADKTMWTTWSWPMTVSEIITSAAKEAGVPRSTSAISNMAGGSISVDLRTVNEDGTYSDPDISMTCRQAIAEALKISGNFGYISNGAFKPGWFDWANPAITIDDTFSASFTGNRAYTGIQVGTREVVGTSDYLYALGNSSFLTDDNASDIESRLATALVGYNFDVGSAGILQNPNIQPGDVVILQTPMGDKTVPITAITLKGSMIEQVVCEANSYDEAEDERTDASNDALAEQVQDGVDVDLSALEQDVSNIKDDTARIDTDISGLSNDITGIKDDLTGINTDLDGLKQDVADLQDALGGHKIVVCTETEYQAMSEHDNTTIYFTY